MRIGIPREIKNHEYRVALTPDGVRALIGDGHQVLVEHDAGRAVGYPDDAWSAVGAMVTDHPAAVWDADLVVKVKEPQPEESGYLRAGLTLFGYLHLAPAPGLARLLAERGVTAVAFETVRAADGSLPLLAPMSAIAGRLAPQVGAQGLMLAHGGAGLLVPGLPGVAPAHVVVLGAGVVGSHAAGVAVGLGARVSVLDHNVAPLARLSGQLGARIETRLATAESIAAVLAEADIVIGAAQNPGRFAPRLIPRALLARMRPGSVLVDVAIDQGGVAETSRPTSHSAPFFVEHGVVHYCVPNMPGAVARTATLALAHATLPYVRALARDGRAAFEADRGFGDGLQIADGRVVHAGLAADLAG